MKSLLTVAIFHVTLAIMGVLILLYANSCAPINTCHIVAVKAYHELPDTVWKGVLTIKYQSGRMHTITVYDFNGRLFGFDDSGSTLIIGAGKTDSPVTIADLWLKSRGIKTPIQGAFWEVKK